MPTALAPSQPNLASLAPSQLKYGIVPAIISCFAHHQWPTSSFKSDLPDTLQKAIFQFDAILIYLSERSYIPCCIKRSTINWHFGTNPGGGGIHCPDFLVCCYLVVPKRQSVTQNSQYLYVLSNFFQTCISIPLHTFESSTTTKTALSQHKSFCAVPVQQSTIERILIPRMCWQNRTFPAQLEFGETLAWRKPLPPNSAKIRQNCLSQRFSAACKDK